MKDYTFEHDTLLNGAAVTVEMSVTWDYPDDSNSLEATFCLEAVYFDGVDISPVLDQNTLTALEMEAESSHIEDSKY